MVLESPECEDRSRRALGPTVRRQDIQPAREQVPHTLLPTRAGEQLGRHREQHLPTWPSARQVILLALLSIPIEAPTKGRGACNKIQSRRRLTPPAIPVSTNLYAGVKLFETISSASNPCGRCNSDFPALISNNPRGLGP